MGRFLGTMRGQIGGTTRSVRRLWAAHPRSMLAGALAVAVAGALALAAALSGSGQSGNASQHATGETGSPRPTAAPVRLQAVSPVGVSAREFARLPRATTFARISAAPPIKIRSPLPTAWCCTH